MTTIKILTKGKKYRRNKVIIPGVQFPNRASAIYRTSLDSMIAQMSNHVRDGVIPVLQARQDEYITDATNTGNEKKTLKQQIKEIIDEIANGFINIDIFAAKVARDHAINTNLTHKKSFINTIRRALGIDISAVIDKEGIRPLIDSHINENIKLIKSIPDEYFKRVRKILDDGLSNGTSVATIQKQLFTQGQNVEQTGALGITKRRARLIARDQTGKLNGQINRSRQLGLGIEQYIWRDRGDSRVREEHVELNGKTFSWKGENRPPEDLDPGQPIQCRCIAEAVVIFD